ncbi:MAG: hypothetical protein M1830_001175 [Pleopsidium flavum]|nr:MAG: hypothetical protein M1830_001175 [Pleopsidium flavum]
MGKPKGSRNKKTLESLNTTVATSTSSQDNQRYDMMTPSESLDNTLNESGPSFNDTVSMSPSAQRSTNSASQMDLDKFPGFESPVESLEAASFRDFSHFETSVDFGPILDFEKPDSAVTWNAHFHRRQSRISNDEDNERYEVDKLDAFNTFTDACLRKPLSPVSSIPTGLSSSEGSSQDNLSWPEHPRSHARGEICACLQSQADQLCRLRAIEQRQQPVKLDMMLHHTMLVMKSSEKLLHCTICRKDRQVLQLTVMVLQSVFGWIDCLCHSEPTRQSGLEVTLGNYAVSGEESNLIQTLLTSRILGRSKVVLNLLATRVEQIVNDGSLLESFDVEYFRHSSQMLTQTLMKMTRRFRLPDVRRQSIRGGSSNISG